MSWEIDEAYWAGHEAGKKEGHSEGYSVAIDQLTTDDIDEAITSLEWMDGALDRIRETGKGSRNSLKDLIGSVADALRGLEEAKEQIEKLS